MQHGQDLEGAQELPLCVDPGSGKEFMDTTGYVSPCGPLPPAVPGMISKDSANRLTLSQAGDHIPPCPFPVLKNPEKGLSGTTWLPALLWETAFSCMTTLLHGHTMPAKTCDPVPTVASLTVREGKKEPQGQRLLPNYCNSIRQG